MSLYLKSILSKKNVLCDYNNTDVKLKKTVSFDNLKNKNLKNYFKNSLIYFQYKDTQDIRCILFIELYKKLIIVDNMFNQIYLFLKNINHNNRVGIDTRDVPSVEDRWNSGTRNLDKEVAKKIFNTNYIKLNKNINDIILFLVINIEQLSIPTSIRYNTELKKINIYKKRIDILSNYINLKTLFLL